GRPRGLAVDGARPEGGRTQHPDRARRCRCRHLCLGHRGRPDVTVLLSLLAAVSYGLGDFNGGIFSKRGVPWAVSLVAQLAGTVAVLVVALVDGDSPDRSDLVWALVAGIGKGCGTPFLYRGLAMGRMGVVAPVSGVGAVVVPVLVGVLTGERPDLSVWFGVVLALPAIWLVSREPASTVDGTTPRGSGVVDGILAGLGFGALF